MLSQQRGKIACMKTIGERIKARRIELTLSQKELGKRTKVSRAAVSQWENGDTKGLRPDNLLAAARALGVSVEWLVTGTHVVSPDSEHAAAPTATESAVIVDLARYRRESSDQQLNAIRSIIGTDGDINRHQLRESISAVCALKDIHELEITADEFADFVLAIYNWFRDGDTSAQARYKLKRLMQIA